MRRIIPAARSRFSHLSAGAIMFLAAWLPGAAWSQNSLFAPAPTVSSTVADGSSSTKEGKTDATSKVDPNVVPAGCSSCSGGLLGGWYGNRGEGGMITGGDGSCGPCGHGCASCCVPGRKPCCACETDNCFGRMLHSFYECICCPDPCYEPCWVAAANNAFFTEAARPVTQLRLVYEGQLNRLFPDRAEFFWARDGNFNGKGPAVANARGAALTDNHDFILINEAAIDKFSIETAIPYRQVASQNTADPTNRTVVAGFADMSIATKSMFLDCELMQMSFLFRTYIPIGNFLKGLGVAHVSLEPGLLWAVKLTKDTYYQAEIAEWIPIGGDDPYAGGMLHYHNSVNHVLWRPSAAVQFVGSGEFFGYTFHSGQFSNPAAVAPTNGTGNAGETALYAGAGLRMVVCDKIDFGTAAAFELTNHVMSEQIYRVEFRWRF